MPLPDYMSNPLFHMGLGLMSVPNQSYAPGAVSWGPGIQRGLLGYQQSLLYQDEQEERRQQQEFRQRKMEWEMQQQQAEQAQAAQAAEAQQAALRARGIPEEQIPLYLNNPSAMQSLFRAPPKATAFEEYAGLTPEQRQTYERMKQAGASRNTTQIFPPGYRGTPGGGTAALTRNPDGSFSVQEVIPGTPQETPEQKQIRADEAADRAATRQVETASRKKEVERQEAREELLRLGVLLEQSAVGVGGAWGTDAANIKRIRNQMAMALAKYRDPGSTIRETERDVALADIPEASGPYDAPRLRTNLESLYATLGASEDAALEGVETRKPDGRYNPATGRVEPYQ